MARSQSRSPIIDRLNAWTKANHGGRGIKQGVVVALLSQVYGVEIPKQTNYNDCWFCNISPCTRANCGDHFDLGYRFPGLGFI